jgi:hypothetical protein
LFSSDSAYFRCFSLFADAAFSEGWLMLSAEFSRHPLAELRRYFAIFASLQFAGHYAFRHADAAITPLIFAMTPAVFARFFFDAFASASRFRQLPLKRFTPSERFATPADTRLYAATARPLLFPVTVCRLPASSAQLMPLTDCRAITPAAPPPAA